MRTGTASTLDLRARSAPERPRGLGDQDSKDAFAFGQEQSTVGQDADLVPSRAEGSRPDVAGNGPAVRVGSTQLIKPEPRSDRTASIGPKLGLISTDEASNGRDKPM